MRPISERSTFSRQANGEKNCTRCFQVKDVGEFYSDKHNRDGLKSECKSCHKQDRKKRRNTDLVGRLITSAKNSARNYDRVFDLRREDIFIPKMCPILGIPLFFDDAWGENSPSIDRVNSDLGYTKDNIIICSWRANHIKGDATIVEMKNIFNNWAPSLIIQELILPNHDQYLERMLKHCKERCIKNNIQFSITKNDLKIPTLCPVLDIPLKPSIKIFSPASPSLDRIDVNYGYVPGNIRIVSWRANKLKSDATFVEYQKIFTFYSLLVSNGKN